VYVVDSSNDRVQKFTSTGTFLTSFGSAGSGNGQFSFPEGIAVNLSGTVYVADAGNGRVELFALPVGGTEIPIDTISLLLYGVQSSAMWWVPAIVIAGAGIGLWQVKKRN
jgi:DNA-binding beta-propeller fold protein YncE